MKVVDTYTATIYVGMRERYSGEVRSIEMARSWLAEYVTRIGLCVTLTPTEFIYKNGSEPGFAIGLINYPRFPSDPAEIRTTAQQIAEAMVKLYFQGKVSIVYPDQTVMSEGEVID